MADYFVASGGSNTAPYDTWAKAATSLQTALTAASTDNDRVIIQYDAVPAGDTELAADTTYAAAASIAIISSTNSGTSTITPTEMGVANWIGNSTTNRSVTFNAASGKYLYIYGLTLRTAGSTADSISISAAGDSGQFALESCYLWQGNTATSSTIQVGFDAGGRALTVNLRNCTFRFGNASQRLFCAGMVNIIGGSLSSAGTIPTSGFFSTGLAATITINGFDLSALANNEICDAHASTGMMITMANCKLGSGFIVSEALTYEGTEFAAFNCSDGDQHYHLYHWNNRGETTVSTGIYAADAAANNKYNGTDRCSWKIVTSANATFYNPYISPWFETYHSGTSAITPSIEVLADRTGSPLKDDEIWGEWSYQGTSGSTQASFVNDRRALAGTAANQANSSLTASDWTGETAGSPTPWFGKLAPASAITPAEIGMLRARVCVGKASTTVYVDPSVRYS